MAAKDYTKESVQRALAHHETNGALVTVSPPYVGRPKWRVVVKNGMAFDFTLAEAHALCVGLAAAEQAYRVVSNGARVACKNTLRPDAPKNHRCRIDTTTDSPFYPGHPGYQAVCDVCGLVGRPDANPRDVQAIANRHEEIGGFER